MKKYSSKRQLAAGLAAALVLSMGVCGAAWADDSVAYGTVTSGTIYKLDNSGDYKEYQDGSGNAITEANFSDGGIYKIEGATAQGETSSKTAISVEGSSKDLYAFYAGGGSNVTVLGKEITLSATDNTTPSGNSGYVYRYSDYTVYAAGEKTAVAIGDSSTTKLTISVERTDFALSTTVYNMYYTDAVYAESGASVTLAGKEIEISAAGSCRHQGPDSNGVYGGAYGLRSAGSSSSIGVGTVADGAYTTEKVTIFSYTAQPEAWSISSAVTAANGGTTTVYAQEICLASESYSIDEFGQPSAYVVYAAGSASNTLVQGATVAITAKGSSSGTHEGSVSNKNIYGVHSQSGGTAAVTGTATELESGYAVTIKASGYAAAASQYIVGAGSEGKDSKTEVQAESICISTSGTGSQAESYGVYATVDGAVAIGTNGSKIIVIEASSAATAQGSAVGVNAYGFIDGVNDKATAIVGTAATESVIINVTGEYAAGSIGVYAWYSGSATVQGQAIKIQAQSNKTWSYGVCASNSGTASVTGADSISISGTGTGSYGYGVCASNSGTASVTGADSISISGTGTGSYGYGVYAESNSTVSITGTDDNSSVSISGTGGGDWGLGVRVYDYSTAEIAGKSISISGTGALYGGYGIRAEFHSEAAIGTENTDCVNISGECATDWGLGVYAGTGSEVKIQGSSVSIQASGVNYGAHAIYAFDNAEVTVEGSTTITVFGNATSSNSRYLGRGIYAFRGSDSPYGGASVSVGTDASQKVSICGINDNYRAIGIDAEGTSTVSIKGQDIAISGISPSQGGIGIYSSASGTQVAVGTAESEKIMISGCGQNSTFAVGVWTKDSGFTGLTANEVAISGTGTYAYGIYDVSSGTTKVTGNYISIYAEGTCTSASAVYATGSGSTVTIGSAVDTTSGEDASAAANIFIYAKGATASDALYAADSGTLTVTSGGTTQVIGDVRALTSGTVSANFAGSDSYLVGAVYTDSVKTTDPVYSDDGTSSAALLADDASVSTAASKLSFTSGAAWYVTDNSTVSELELSDGGRVVLTDNSTLRQAVGLTAPTISNADDSTEIIGKADQANAQAITIGQLSGSGGVFLIDVDWTANLGVKKATSITVDDVTKTSDYIYILSTGRGGGESSIPQYVAFDLTTSDAEKMTPLTADGGSKLYFSTVNDKGVIFSAYKEEMLTLSTASDLYDYVYAIDKDSGGVDDWYIYLVEAKEKEDESDNPTPTPAKRPNENVKAVELRAQADYLLATDMDRLNKRLGEARYLDGEDKGLWARYQHSRNGLKGDSRTGSNMFQLGYDDLRYTRDSDKDAVHAGIAFDYKRANTSFYGTSGHGETDMYSLMGYRTWFGSYGHYSDFTAKVGVIDSDYDAYMRGSVTGAKGDTIHGEYDRLYAQLGAEYGRRIDISVKRDEETKAVIEDKGWFFEPQSQLQYTYFNDKSFNTDAGVNVNLSAASSLIGRLGFRLGRTHIQHPEWEPEPYEAQEDPRSIAYKAASAVPWHKIQDPEDFYHKNNWYIKADILHEFLDGGHYALASNGSSYRGRYAVPGTWYDAGFGFDTQIGHDEKKKLRSYFHGDIEYRWGGDYANSWEFNVGLQFEFN